METKRKLKVIVFEDDPAMSKLFRKMLLKFGHDVQTFPDPTACAVYNSPECDCPMDTPCADAIITDIMMPNMDGIEFFKLQRSRGCRLNDENKALMSAVSTAQQQAAVKELGCNFFRKPFKIVEIKKWLEECAERIH